MNIAHEYYCNNNTKDNNTNVLDNTLLIYYSSMGDIHGR